MKITARHLEFWRQRKVPLPAWARKARGFGVDPVTVDDLIPGPPLDCHHHNTMQLIAGNRRRGGMTAVREILQEMATDGDPRFKNRAARCRKYLARIGSPL